MNPHLLPRHLFDWRLLIPVDVIQWLGLFFVSGLTVLPAYAVKEIIIPIDFSIVQYIRFITLLWAVKFYFVLQDYGNGTGYRTQITLPGILFWETGGYPIIRKIAFTLAIIIVLGFSTFPFTYEYVSEKELVGIYAFCSAIVACLFVHYFMDLHHEVNTVYRDLTKHIREEKQRYPGATVIAIVAGGQDKADKIHVEYCTASQSSPILVWTYVNGIPRKEEIYPDLLWKESHIIGFISCLLSPYTTKKNHGFNVMSRQYT